MFTCLRISVIQKMKTLLLLPVIAVCFVNTSSAKNLELLILHNNDMHARFEETSAESSQCVSPIGHCYGGMARTLHVIKEARKAAQKGTGPPVLYLNAGDTYGGSMWFDAYKSEIISAFLNLLKPDAVRFKTDASGETASGLRPTNYHLTELAWGSRRRRPADFMPPLVNTDYQGMAAACSNRGRLSAFGSDNDGYIECLASLGSREFNSKVIGVLPFIKAANFPIVAANLDFSKEPELKSSNITKSVVLEVSGKKIGIIGYLTPNTKSLFSTGKIGFEDEIEAIRKESEALDKQGVKIIIALGHSGFEMDKKIGIKVPLVDLVIGGLSNTFLGNSGSIDLEKPQGDYPFMVKQISGKQVPVVQAYAYTKYIGNLKVTFNDAGDVVTSIGQPILLSHEVPQDGEALKLLDSFRQGLNDFKNEVVGYTYVTLEGDSDKCQRMECNLGNLIADAFVAYVAAFSPDKYWTYAPIAMTSGGRIRDTIKRNEDGKVTRGDLLNVLPYQEVIYTMDIKGSDLKETLELGVRDSKDENQLAFLQSSGIRYVIDFTKPAGSRIEEVKVLCGICNIPKYSPLEKNRTYTMITTGFLSNGGYDHKFLQQKAINKISTDVTDLEIVSWYISNRSPIFQDVDERIIVTSGSKAIRFSTCLVFIVVTLLSIFMH